MHDILLYRKSTCARPMTAFAPSPSGAAPREADGALDTPQVLDHVDDSAAPSSAELDVA
jgi:hypothetical protein